jgi:enoyl-CoA hydratase/carnithine racemase
LSTAHTTFTTEGPLAILTFNRPEARNAMTWDMYDALADACARVDDDRELRVLVLRGAGGKAFVAGTDISQFQAFRGPADGLAYEKRLDAVLDRLERVAKPTIAQVQGVAAGGGCAIAITCDLSVATPESTFGIPIARTLGNCLSGAGYSRLVDLIGPARVKDVLFTGRFVGAAEAHAIGMVTRLVAADAIEQAVHDLALDIASHAPLTLRATKEMLRRLAAKRRLAAGEDRDLIELCYKRRFPRRCRVVPRETQTKWTGSRDQSVRDWNRHAAARSSTVKLPVSTASTLRPASASLPGVVLSRRLPWMATAIVRVTKAANRLAQQSSLAGRYANTSRPERKATTAFELRVARLVRRVNGTRRIAPPSLRRAWSSPRSACPAARRAS